VAPPPLATLLIVVVRSGQKLSPQAQLDPSDSAPAHRDAAIKAAWLRTSFEWPYVVLLVGIVVMVAAALHLLLAWVVHVIFGALWVGFAIWPKGHR
jgi:hypothetical protein